MVKKFLSVAMAVCLIAFMILSTPVKAATTQTVMNAIQWADTNGNPIQAHGGGMIKAGSYYYWFGENRDDTGHFQGVSCYRSTDLKNWTYNASTGQYVMWMHWENGNDYGQARAAVAYCSSVDGSYTYQGSFRPMTGQGITDHGIDGYMSRDCSLFVDTDGTAYFISAANENADLMLYKLTSSSFSSYGFCRKTPPGSNGIFFDRSRYVETVCLLERKGWENQWLRGF